MKHEWEHEGKPPYLDAEFQVWDGEEVRNVRRVFWFGNKNLPGPLFYTDCTHPMQNILCHEPQIKAWRLVELAP